MKTLLLGSTLALALSLALAPASAQAVSNPLQVLDAGKIDSSGSVTLLPESQFGWSVAYLVDLDLDGNMEVAVGAPRDDEMGNRSGAVWLISLDANFTIVAANKIVLPTEQEAGDLFGHGVANVGDLDGDGLPELAVGAPGDDAGAVDAGAVYILHLEPDGTLASYTKLAFQTGGFGGALESQDEFGYALCALGDLNNDLVPDLVVGAPGDADNFPAASDTGAIYVIFLGPAGNAVGQQKVSTTSGGLPDLLDEDDRFGCSVAAIGDIDGDLRNEIVVGAMGTEDPFLPVNTGAVWVLFLEDDGTVVAQTRISATSGNFAGPLSGSDGFGVSVAGIGDIDRDLIPDIAVGVERQAFVSSGAVWLLTLDAAGAAKSEAMLTSEDIEEGVEAPDKFGRGLAAVGLSIFNSVLDGGLEGGPSNTAWQQTSTNFGTPLCTANCNLVGNSGPRTDDWLLRFGAAPNRREQSSVQQNVRFRSDTLILYLWNPISSGKTTGLDSFTVKIDNVIKFQAFEGNPAYADGYTQVRIDVSDKNDGNLHLLRLEADTSGKDNSMPALAARTDFLVDDILLFEAPSIGPVSLIVGAPNDDEVGLDSGALWSMSLEGPLVAEAASRNGGTNPVAYTTTLTPQIDRVWSASIVRRMGSGGSAMTWGSTAVLGFKEPSTGFNLAIGRVLVDLSSTELFVDVKVAPSSNPPDSLVHTFPVPNDLNLIGLTLATQGFRFMPGGNTTMQLLNAIDLTIGH